MEKASFHKNPWIVSSALFLLAFFIYLATRSHNYSGDSMIFALAVESDWWSILVDPYHLLPPILGWGVCRIVQALGWEIRSIYLLQGINASFGAACVGLMYAISYHVTRRWQAALVAALGLAFSGGFWLLSTDAEFVTPGLAIFLAVFYGLISTSPNHPSTNASVIFLGLGLGLAMLSYLNGAFLLVVAAAAYWSSIGIEKDKLPIDPRHARSTPIIPRKTLRSYLVLVGIALLVALLPLILTLNWLSKGDWRMLAYLGGGSAYGKLAWDSLPRSVYAFLRSLALYPGLGPNERTLEFFAQANLVQRAVFLSYYVLILCMVCFPLVIAWMQRRSLWAGNRRFWAAWLAWSVLYAAFAFYWVPSDSSFWMPLLVAWWMMIAVLVSRARSSSWLKVVALGIVLLLLLNFFLAINPYHDPVHNAPLRIALFFKENSSSQDLIIVPPDSILVLYIPYFAGRNALPLALDQSLISSQESVGRLIQNFTQTLGGKGRIFVADLHKDHALALEKTLETSGTPFDMVPIWQVSDHTIWEINP